MMTSTVGQGVTTKHKAYMDYQDAWTEIRDHLEGSRQIKSKGEEYLPPLGKIQNSQDQADYDAYLERALYYEATKRTHQAMLGALLMKPPQFNNIPEKTMKSFYQVTMDGYSMDTFIRNVLSELIAVSRTGVLVERAKSKDGRSGPMYLVQYKAEDIINWKFERVNDRIILTMVVLREIYSQTVDRFASEDRERYRVLELTDGIYTQTLFEGVSIKLANGETQIRYSEQGTAVPVNVGKPLNFIPFVFFTPMGNVPTVCEPLLTGISTVNLSHYRTSADLEHGRHFTGLPTAWVAGFDTETELKIGSHIAWVSDNPSARAGFLEFTGTGLNALVTALDEKQEQMATMGARMLRPPKTGVEAAETARIYQSAESGTLSSLSMAASESFTVLLQYWLMWEGAEQTDEVSVDLNTDYIDTRIDSGSVTALVSAYLSGAISFETLFFNLQQGEVIPDGVTVEDEKDLIASQGPPGGSHGGQMLEFNSPPKEKSVAEPEPEVDENDQPTTGE